MKAFQMITLCLSGVHIILAWSALLYYENSDRKDARIQNFVLMAMVFAVMFLAGTVWPE